MMEIILLAKGFEEIEAITIIDVLRRAEIPVKTVSITENKEVEGAHYISVVCDETLQNIAPNEIERVILPGGWGGTYALAENQRVLELIRAVNANHKEIAAICAAPYVLDKADVLKHEYACYPSVEEQIEHAHYNSSSTTVIKDENIITSRGPATAIDFALYLVKQQKGDEVANSIASALLYEKP